MKFYRTKTLDIMTENQISANLRFIEKNKGSGKVVISNESKRNLVRFQSRIQHRIYGIKVDHEFLRNVLLIRPPPADKPQARF